MGITIFFIILLIVVIVPVVTFVLFINIYQKKFNKIKEQCVPQKFELLDILVVPEIFRKNRNKLKVIFVMKMLENNEIYFANIDNKNCFCHIATTCRFNIDKTVSGIKLIRRDRNEGTVNLSIGDTGVCSIQEVLPYEFKYTVKTSVDINKRVYGKCVYIGNLNENSQIRKGEYCNCNKDENVIENLQNLKEIKGLVELDEF